jgi:hypothetical protein
VPQDAAAAKANAEPQAAPKDAEDLRAFREMFPGGAAEALALREAAREAESLRQSAQELRQAAQAVDQIDAAIFSGDARAQSQVVADLARANPGAFRQLFAEAARVLAGMPPASSNDVVRSARSEASRPGGARNPSVGDGDALELQRDSSSSRPIDVQASSQGKEAGTPRNDGAIGSHPPTPKDGFGGLAPHSHDSAGVARSASSVTSAVESTGHASASGSPATGHESRITNHESPFGQAQGERDSLRQALGQAGHESRVTLRQGSGQANHGFDAAAYASFERGTNDAVARDVRAAIGDTLGRVLPDGIAEGAARRIGDDIFNEIHRTLAADRTLSEQVGDVLQGWRFGAAEQQRVASLLAGRARQLVPRVARRVVGEWTSSVLGTARNKAARQAAAAARVDIAAPGGSLDSRPLAGKARGEAVRPMAARGVDYGSMSDDEILSM